MVPGTLKRCSGRRRGPLEMAQGGWVKPVTAVIDVGINRVGTLGGKGQPVGDIAYDAAADVTSGITPVPGRVGPMTVACLLHKALVETRAQAEQLIAVFIASTMLRLNRVCSRHRLRAGTFCSPPSIWKPCVACPRASGTMWC